MLNNAVVRRFGSIESLAFDGLIQMTSVYDQRGTPDRVDYVTTKTALIGLTRAAAAPVSQILCEFVSQSHWEDIPNSVRHEAKRSLLNYLAVAFAGAHDPTLNILVDTLAAYSAGPHCSLIGRAEKTDM